MCTSAKVVNGNIPVWKLFKLLQVLTSLLTSYNVHCMKPLNQQAGIPGEIWYTLCHFQYNERMLHCGKCIIIILSTRKTLSRILLISSLSTKQKYHTRIMAAFFRTRDLNCQHVSRHERLLCFSMKLYCVFVSHEMRLVRCYAV